MTKYLSKIRSVFDEKFFDILSIYDAGDRFLFCIKNKDYDGNPLDPYYTIDKTTLKIKGFMPHIERNVFKKALNNEIHL